MQQTKMKTTNENCINTFNVINCWINKKYNLTQLKQNMVSKLTKIKLNSQKLLLLLYFGLLMYAIKRLQTTWIKHENANK